MSGKTLASICIDGLLQRSNLIIEVCLTGRSPETEKESDASVEGSWNRSGHTTVGVLSFLDQFSILGRMLLLGLEMYVPPWCKVEHL